MTDLDELKALWSDAPQVLALIERLEKAEGALKPFAMLSKAMLENELPAKILEDNFTPVLSCGSVYRDDWAVEVYVADLRTASRALGGEHE